MLRAALTNARSDDPRQHADLLAQLKSESVLEQLDSEAEYQMASKFRLHVAQVLEALARNAAPSARHTFVALTDNPIFLGHDERCIALIRASEHMRPAPPELVAFWDQHSQPDDGYTPTTITALVANGSTQAIALLEKKLADPAHDEGEKISWMRSDMLSHRNDVSLLEACERLLTDALPENLRPFLVDALFDYRPEEWFKPAKSYAAPPLQTASRATLDQLLRVGAVVLAMVRLSDERMSVVKLRLQDASTVRDRWPR